VIRVYRRIEEDSRSGRGRRERGGRRRWCIAVYTLYCRCSWQAKPRAGEMKSPPYTEDYRCRRVAFA